MEGRADVIELGVVAIWGIDGRAIGEMLACTIWDDAGRMGLGLGCGRLAVTGVGAETGKQEMDAQSVGDRRGRLCTP